MSQKPVENVPSISILTVQQLSLELEEKLPDVRSVQIEPHRALTEDELPAVVVAIGEEDVLSVNECQSHNMSVVDGVMAQPCSHYEYQLRQTLYIEVVVDQCEGAYARAERIMYMVKQIAINSGTPGLFYDGKANRRSDDSASSAQYAVSARFFKTYCYPEERE